MPTALVHALIGACLLASSFSVRAEDERSGLYVGLSVGQSRYSDAAPRLFFGYEASEHFAVELGVADLGTKSTPTGWFGAMATTSIQVIDVVGVFSWPVRERLFLHGKLGLYGAANDSRSDDGFVDASSIYAGGVTFGVGGRYDFTDRFAARLEWQRYSDSNADAVDLVSLGALLRF